MVVDHLSCLLLYFAELLKLRCLTVLPRKGWSITIRKRSRSVPASLSVSPRTAKKRKEWNDENMRAALKAVQDRESVSRAARDHGIPKTTLYDRISGKFVHGISRPRPYLTPGEEKELGIYLKHCAKVGYGKTRRDVLALTQTAAELKEQKREEMKQKREEEQRRTAEERAKKAEQEKAQQEEEKARKAEEKARSMGKQPINAGVKRTHDSDRCTGAKMQPQQKMPRIDVDSFDESKCCVRFVTYEEDQSGKD